MNKEMTFKMVFERIYNNDYKNKLDYPSFNNPKYKKLREDHVFDENLTIKENRERIKKHNDDIDNYKEQYKEEEQRLNQLFEKDLINAISYENSLSKEVAARVYNQAYKQGHSSGMHEVVNYAIDYSDFAYEILQLKDKE